MKEFREELTYRFEQIADPELAIPMKAYLKGRFDMYGIKAPDRKAAYKDLMAQTKSWSYAEIESMAVWCWDQPQRDYHYFGTDLVQKRQKKLPEESIDLLEWMITNNSWWDAVDSLASNPVGTLARKYASVWDKMEEWIDHDNMWLRRSALIYQLKSKDEMDEERLFDFSLRRKEETEFFIRKAIGWALRQYSAIDKEAVIKFVENNQDFSGLTKREALKHKFHE